MIIRPEGWISKPDDGGNGCLKVWVVEGNAEFPMPVETHNVFLDDVKIDEEQDFDFVLECADKPKVYQDEEAYGKEHGSMAPESVIPVGLFSAFWDEDFKTPHIILNGRVEKTYKDPTLFGFEESDVLFSLTCLGNRYDAVMHSEFADGVEMKEGSIISCVYWVQGWPKDI